MAIPIAAKADTININYYTISSSDPDANELQGGVFNNEVQNSLGSSAGMPVLNLTRYGCVSNCYAQAGAPGFPLNGTGPNVNLLSDGEITYWDPAANPYVTETLTTATSLPFNVPSNFFPPNGTGSSDGGSNGFQAAELYGTLNVPSPESISFSIGSDDMSFAYLDGQLVCSDGGVHVSSSVPCTTPGVISAGDHSLEVFFVDMNQTQSGLSFSVTTQGVTINEVPEPTTLALLGTGLVGLAWARRRAA